jgi:acyl carrier protein
VWTCFAFVFVAIASVAVVVWHHYSSQVDEEQLSSAPRNQGPQSARHFQQAFEAEVRYQIRLIRERQRFDDVEQYVIATVAEKLSADKERINRRTDVARDLGADSLDLVELAMDLEEHFDIHIPDDQTSQIRTVGDAVDFIRTALTRETHSTSHSLNESADTAPSGVLRESDDIQYDDGNDEVYEEWAEVEGQDDSEESLEARLEFFPAVEFRSADGHALRVHYVADYFPARFGKSKHRTGASGAVLSLKSGETAGVRYFAQQLASCISSGDAAIAVPGHTAGPARGGLRALIAALHEVDDLSNCLVRTAGVPSSKMARSEGYARPTEALHLQTLAAASPDRIRGRTILLMDDVLTTGATLSAAATVLRRAGAAQVCCLALTRTVRN